MTEPNSLPKPKIIVVLAKGYIAVLRVLGAVFLGVELGAMFAAAFNLHDWAQDATMFSGVTLCVIFGRNRLLLLLGLTFVLYFVGLGYSRHKIASFCSSITVTTHPSELTSLAERAQVEFRSAPVTKEPGKFYGRACDHFSVCDYGCAVEFDSNHVISSKTYNH